ncbi:MAG: hypothetical protein ACREUT_08700 [Steroidobacteraceae bacterium]
MTPREPVSRVDLPARQLAFVLVWLAARLMPGVRREWAAAMESELAFFHSGKAALAWACGCLCAAARERVASMRTGNWKISRSVAALEMLLCFAPLTLGWWDGIAGVSGLLRFIPIIEHGQLARVPGGASYLALMICVTIISTAGPLGLILAFRFLVLGRSLRSRWLCGTLIAGPLLRGAPFFIYGVPWEATHDPIGFYSGMLLLSILPACGALHLFHLGSAAPDRPNSVLAAG